MRVPLVHLAYAGVPIEFPPLGVGVSFHSAYMLAQCQETVNTPLPYFSGFSTKVFPSLTPDREGWQGSGKGLAFFGNRWPRASGALQLVYSGCCLFGEGVPSCSSNSGRSGWKMIWSCNTIARTSARCFLGYTYLVSELIYLPVLTSIRNSFPLAKTARSQEDAGLQALNTS